MNKETELKHNGSSDPSANGGEATDHGSEDRVNLHHGSGPKFSTKADFERPQMKRFYKQADFIEAEAGFQIQLDDRPVKTPLKADLNVPSASLATLIVDEWNAQGDIVDPATMYCTKIANTAIDRVGSHRGEVIAELVNYGLNDLLLYRADSPQSLIDRQIKFWDPVLAWARDNHKVNLNCTSGIVHRSQPEHASNALKAVIGTHDNFALTALHNMTTLLGSALLPLALKQSFIDLEMCWRAAHVDEDYQIEKWGEDEEARARRALRFAEYQSCYRILNNI